MLKESLSGKTIVILAYQTLTARLLLRKLINLTDPIPFILAIETSKEATRRSQFLSDPYFTAKQRQLLSTQVSYVPLDQIPQKLIQRGKTHIDLLFSLHLPVDFSNQEKLAQYHLLHSTKIAQTLSKVRIVKCVHLSSIYYHDAGYVPQQDELEDSHRKQQFHNRQQAHLFLKQNFASVVDAWKWSIEFVEKTYQRVSENICILRVPSLGPTLTHFEGYTLKFNYFTYLIYQVGTGLLRNIEGNKSNKLDIVPTDYVSNFLLVLASRSCLKGETVNLSTSTRNYVTLQQFINTAREAWQEYGEKTRQTTVTETVWGRKLKRNAQSLPSSVKKRLGSMLDVVSWKIEGVRGSLQAEQKFKLLDKYRYFLSQEWHCESNKAIDLFNQLSPQQQTELNFNVNSINWKTYIRLCVYAIKKHLLNQYVEQFKPQTINLLGAGDHSYFSDVMWALRQGKSTKGQTRNDSVQWVLNSKAVKEAIRMLAEEQMLKLQNTPASFEKAEQELSKVAEQMCVQMFSDYSMKSIRLFAWFLHKVFSTIYQRVVIDKVAVSKLQSHNETTQGPIIIIPTHRSYIDFLIMSYVFFGNGIKCPHIAAAEDFLNMAVIHILLRKSGAFFIKRNQKKYKQLYKAIMGEYISQLMGNNHYLQFFIQGTRSRTGKMLSPKFGMLSIVASNVAEGRVVDAHILPVTINYEKVLEGNSFTYEMMGQAKVKESLSRLLKAADVLKENYGRIYIELCPLISVKQWLSSSTDKFEQKVAQLGNRIVQQLSNNLVISGPAIVSSVVLMHRKGISDDALQEKTSWLCRELSSRGVKITRSQADSSISVNSTLGLLEGILTKSKKDMFEVQVSFDQNSFVKLFTLTYYRNTLTHIFFQEALVATALASFGHQQITTKTVTVSQLYMQSSSLWNLLQNEFYLSEPLTSRRRFDEVLEVLVLRGVLRREEDYVIGLQLTGNYFAFYWSLVWPIVQAYWVTCLYLFKLLKNVTAMPIAKFLTQIQWFGQSLINQRIIGHLQAISSDTIKNAVALFSKMKLLSQLKQDYNGEQVVFVKISTQQNVLRQTLQKIEGFLKSSYAKSLKGILESGQASVNVDFPFLSRL